MKRGIQWLLLAVLVIAGASCRELVAPASRVGGEDDGYNEFWFTYPDGRPIAHTLVEVDDISYLQVGQRRTRLALYTDAQGFLRVPRPEATRLDVLLRPEPALGLHPYLYLGLESGVARRHLRFPGTRVDFRLRLPEGLRHLELAEGDLEFERTVPWPDHESGYHLDFKLPLAPDGTYCGQIATGNWRVYLYRGWTGDAVRYIDWEWDDVVVEATTQVLELEVPVASAPVTWQTPPDARTTHTVLVLPDTYRHEVVTQAPALGEEGLAWFKVGNRVRVDGLVNSFGLLSPVIQVGDQAPASLDFGSLGRHELNLRFHQDGAPIEDLRCLVDTEQGTLVIFTDEEGRGCVWLGSDLVEVEWRHPDTSQIHSYALDLSDTTSVDLEVDLDDPDLSF